MRPTSPSNRISAYYSNSGGLSTTEYPVTAGHSQSTHYHPPSFRRRIGGRVAGIVASVLQLAVSALCVAGAMSSWLGYPIGIAPTTAVFLGGLLFGTISLLQLYSVVTDATNEEISVAYDNKSRA